LAFLICGGTHAKMTKKHLDPVPAFWQRIESMSTVHDRKTRQVRSKAAGQVLAPRAIALAAQQVMVPASAHTLAGYRAWAKSEAFPNRGQIFFLDQEIYIDMSPEELENHAKVKAEVGRVLMNINRKQKRGEFYPDGSLVTNVEANLSTEPDGSFVTWEALESGRVRLVPREGAQGEYMELEGSSDWVLEIISKYSVRKDTKTLRERYHRAKVSEYWLIDARSEKIEFTILTWHEGGYHVSQSQGGWQRSEVFRRWFQLVRRRGRMKLWEYTLQTKSLRK
jgi:Uma2 family endonuclease